MRMIAGMDRTRLVVPAALLIALLPLIWPATPPLTDLPNHMSRYRIALDPALFAGRFDFHWALVGNLGVDLLVMPLAWLFGLEPAVKLATMAIVAANVGGMLFVAREVHGRIPATAAFALPFAYNYAFNYGFVNFALAMGLALLAFGLWLRLGRQERRGLRTALFVPIGGLVWLAHVYGWVTLGILIFASEAVTRRDEGAGWGVVAMRAGIACLPLGVPLLGMASWLGGTPSAQSMQDLPEFWHKLLYLFLSLRDGHAAFDVVSVGIVWALLAVAVAHRAFGFERRLAGCALLLGLAYAIMPGTLMGAFYADMRLAPYVIALATLAVSPRLGSGIARWAGMLGIAFLIARTGVQTITYARLDRAYAAQLEALDHLPRGARIFASARTVCFDQWDDPRMTHLARMAVVRRDAFVNGSWPRPGAQMLFARPEMTPGYVDQDSELLKPAYCRDEQRFSVSGALAQLPREHYDYYWLIGVPPAAWPHRPWLKPIWHRRDGILYRIVPPGRTEGA